MRVWLESVRFRIPEAPENGAFAVSVASAHGGRVVVSGPEWRVRQPRLPAAFAAPPGGLCTFVEVELRCDELRDVSLPFKADARPDDMLGAIAPTIADFRNGRWSGRVSLPGACIGRVGRQTIRWTWQVADQPFAIAFENPESEHDVYSVIATPKCPWDPCAGDVVATPWVEALDVATAWAGGTSSTDEALSAITASVFRLGQEQPPRLAYGTSSFAKGKGFNLRKFLDALDAGAAQVDCADCAAIVSTLSNLVGADSDQVVLIAREGAFITNPVTMIGESEPRTLGFNQHETAWDVRDVRKARVWDACIGIGGNGRTQACTAIPFDGGEAGYGQVVFGPSVAREVRVFEYVRRHLAGES